MLEFGAYLAFCKWIMKVLWAIRMCPDFILRNRGSQKRKFSRNLFMLFMLTLVNWKEAEI